MSKLNNTDFSRDYQTKWKLIEEAQQKAALARQQMQRAEPVRPETQRTMSKAPLATTDVSP